MTERGDGSGRLGTARLVREVLARLRHDMRSPLNAILGYSELILEDAVGHADPAFVSELRRIHDCGATLLGHVNRVLEPARVEQEGPFDLGALGLELRDVCEALVASVHRHADTLAAGAARAGMADAVPDLERIRSAATRLQSLLDDVAGFAGDPLSTASGGPPPEWALQIGASDFTTGESEVIDFAANAPTERGSVLVVDDSESNRDILTRYLLRRGHTVRTAASGRAALEALAAERFDLVMLDIVMPEMNGFEVLERIVVDDAIPQVPVIFISALDDAFGKVRAFRGGGVDYVTKPFQAEEVLARVENQLKISRLQRDLERQNVELVRKNEELTRAQRRSDRMFTALSDVLPGSVLDGKYRLDEKIGAGGFGAVYRGCHMNLDKPVAVKVFRPVPGNDDPNALERFLREGVSASRLNHPNAVAVLDSGITRAGIAFLVMELLEGRTLADEIREKGMVSLARAVQVLVPVCDVLAEAHALNLVHRDVKPDNVFLHESRDGEVVKVVDFGLAKMFDISPSESTDQTTLAGRIAGTPAYMAPERLTSLPYDGRADIYSVGVILFELVTGQRPYASMHRELYAALVAQLTHDPPSVREIMPTLPVEVDTIVKKALSRDPGDRPSALELGHMLAGLASAAKRQSEASTARLPTAPGEREESPTLDLPAPRAEE